MYTTVYIEPLIPILRPLSMRMHSNINYSAEDHTKVIRQACGLYIHHGVLAEPYQRDRGDIPPP